MNNKLENECCGLFFVFIILKQENSRTVTKILKMITSIGISVWGAS